MVSLCGSFNKRPNKELPLDTEAITAVNDLLCVPRITGTLAFEHTNALARAIISLCICAPQGRPFRDLQGRPCRRVSRFKEDWQAVIVMSEEGSPGMYNWTEQPDNAVLLSLGIGTISSASRTMYRRNLQVRCNKGRLLCDLTKAIFDCSETLIGQSCIFSGQLKTLEYAVDWEGFDHKISDMLNLHK